MRYTVPNEDGGVKYMRYVSRVDWRNLRLFMHLRLVKQAGICTPWGNLILSDWLPFSYKYGPNKPLWRAGKYSLIWVALKAMEEDIDPSLNQPAEGSEPKGHSYDL